MGVGQVALVAARACHRLHVPRVATPEPRVFAAAGELNRKRSAPGAGAALGDQVRDGRACIREQHAWADAAEGAREFHFREVAHHEDAGLLHLDQEHRRLFVLGGYRDSEDDFAQLRGDAVDGGVEVQADLRIPGALDALQHSAEAGKRA